MATIGPCCRRIVSLQELAEGTDNPDAHHGDENNQFRSHGDCHALYKVFCLITTGLPRWSDTARSCKAKRQQRDDREMHQQSAHPHERFADPKRHAEIESQDAIVEAGA